MAQSIKLKRSAVVGKTPLTSSLELGELAVNTTDGKIYFHRSSSSDDTVQTVFTTDSTITGSLKLSGSQHISGSIGVMDDITFIGDMSSSLTSTSSFSRLISVETASIGYLIATGSNFATFSDNTGSFASGSDVQVILAESASYVVSTNTGSFLQNSDTGSLGDISGSITSTASFGKILGDGGDLTNVADPAAISGSYLGMLSASHDLTLGLGVSGSITSTASFGKILGDGGDLTNVADPAAISGSYLGMLSASHDLTLGLGISGSLTSTASFGKLELVDSVHISPFASGSDVQVILAESASYVVSTNTGSYASGSSVQTILDDYAKGTEISGSYLGLLSGSNDLTLGLGVSGSITSTASFGNLKLADYGGLPFASGSDLHTILAQSASYVTLDETGSFASGSDVSQIQALTASYLQNSDSASLQTVGIHNTLFVSGNITTSGSVIAREFKTEFVSSSIIYSSGSNKFGDTLDDLHRFTGSLETTSSTLTIDSVGGVSGSITSTGSFGKLLGDGSDLSNLPESFTSAVISGSYLGLLSGSNDLTLGLGVSGSLLSTGSFGNLKLVNYGGLPFASGSDLHTILAESASYVTLDETGSFASGSDIQIILAESASYVVSTGTGSYVTNSQTSSFASGSSVQTILDDYAKGTEISGSYLGLLSGSNDLTIGLGISGSITSTASFGKLELVDTVHISPFASGSDVQVILAESASYVVSTGTGSYVTNSQTSSFASGSDVQIIQAESASYVSSNNTASLHQVLAESASYLFNASTASLGKVTLASDITGSITSTGSFGSLVTPGLSTLGIVSAGVVSATSLDADGGVTIDNITIDGTEIDLSSGDLTIDVAGDIDLDAGGQQIKFSSAGTAVGQIDMAGTDLEIKSLVSNATFTLRGNDGGSEIDMLAFDVAGGGKATFLSDVTPGGNVSGSITSTGSFHRIEGDTISVSNSPFASGSDVSQIQALTTSLASGSDVQQILAESASYVVDSDTGSLHQVLAESASYVVSTNTGSFLQNSDTASLATAVVVGKISGSSTTTASFGHLAVGGKTYTHQATITSAGNTNSVVRIDADDGRGASRYALDIVDDDTNSRGSVRISTTSGPSIIATGDILTSGSITAQEYIVNSSVTNVTQSFSSGSTIFGDTPGSDTHRFTGSLEITGSGGIVVQGNVLELNNTGDWSYIRNNTNSGGLRFGSKDSGGNLANQIEISNTGNYVKLNENTTVTGTLDATGHITTNGEVRLDTGGDSIAFYGVSDANYRRAMYADSDDHFITNRHTGGDLILMSNNGSAGGELERLRFKAGSSIQNAYFSNVNVGIGNTAPTEKLVVEGNISQSLTSTGSFGELRIPATSKLWFDGGNGTYIHESANDLLDIYAGGVLMLRIEESGVDSVFTMDNVRLGVGSSKDMVMYHDGTNSYIDNDVGYVKLRNLLPDGDMYLSTSGSEGQINAITIDASNTGRVKLPNDNQYLTIGASGDLYMYHDGSNSFIRNATGDLYIKNDTDDGDIIFQSDDGSGGTTTYMYLDGSQKFVTINDNIQLTIGTGQDLRMYHDASNTYLKNYTGTMFIEQHTDDGFITFKCDNGSGGIATYFFLDGANVRTQFNKGVKFVDDARIQVGTGTDLEIWHDGTNSYIENATGNLHISSSTSDGDILISVNDGGTKLEAILIDGSVVGSVYLMNDNQYIGMGAGNDLRFWHDGTNSYVYNYGGELRIGNTVDDADITLWADDQSGGNAAYITLDGSAGDLLLTPPSGRISGSITSTGSFGELRLPQTGKLWFDGGSQTYIQESQNDVLDFYVGAVHMFRMNESGTDSVFTMDNVRLGVGSGPDLVMHHDGTDSYIVNSTGDLHISSSAVDKDILISVNDSGSILTAVKIDASAVGTVYLPNDNQNFYMGASNDFRIVHNGTDTYLNNYTGNYILTQEALDKDISFRSDDGSGGSTEYFRLDGSEVELTVLKQMLFQDSVKALFGTGSDLEIYHDGSHHYFDTNNGNFYFRDESDNNLLALAREGGGLYLYEGDIIIPATGKLRLDNSDSGNTYINESSGDIMDFTVGGARMLRLDEGNDLTTISGSLEIDANISGSITSTGSFGSVVLPDFGKAIFGASSDLQMYHNGGGNSNIDNLTGDLYVTQYKDDGDIIFRSDDGSGGNTNYMVIDGGAVAIDLLQDTRLKATKKLYFDGGGNTYINEDAADRLRFFVGGAEFMRFTESTGNSFTIYQDVYIGDSLKMHFGAGNDLKLYHDGSNSSIENHTGNLYIDNNTDNGEIIFRCDDNSGSLDPYLTLVGTTPSVVINEDSADINFRVESDGNANLLFTDGLNNLVGIGTDAPTSLLHIFAGDGSITDDSNNHLLVEDNAHSYIGIGGGTSSDVGIHFMDSGGIRGRVAYHHATDSMTFKTANTVQWTMDSSGNVEQTGDISGSITTTGSFGKIEADTYSLATLSEVSGGITSTGSFGRLDAHSDGIGSATLLHLDNYVGADLTQQQSYIDFSLRDSNDNHTPQVRIGAEVGHNGDANTQQKEGSGAFIVFTTNAGGTSTDLTDITEKFRVDYLGDIHIKSGSMNISGSILPTTDNKSDLGSAALRWDDVFAAQTTIGAVFETGLRTKGIGQHETGTIVVWRNGGLVPCDKDEDTMVMGVTKKGKDEPIVMGAEPVLVTGDVKEGDFITTSTKSGYGKKLENGYLLKKEMFGKVIAQALEDSTEESSLIKCMIRKM